MCMSLFGTEFNVQLITSQKFFSLRSHFYQDFCVPPDLATCCCCHLSSLTISAFSRVSSITRVYESNLNLPWLKLTVHLFYNDVTFATLQWNCEILCVLLKKFLLASLAFSSFSVYPISIVVLSRVLIRVSKQFKVAICEQSHKSHHPARDLDGATLLRKSVPNPSAQRDMNILRLQETF